MSSGRTRTQRRDVRRRGALLGLGLLTLLLLAPVTAVATPVDLPVPGITQHGEVTNCGPTVAAMVTAAYNGTWEPAAQAAVRDTLGAWSWHRFPLRQLRVPGYDAGLTTPDMMQAMLERGLPDARVSAVGHPWLPGEVWGVVTLQARLAERKPVIVLAQASDLWELVTPGLHWVVVRGLSGGDVVFNDPADGTRVAIPWARFWRAWRLNALYRSLPMHAAFQGLVVDAPLPRLTVAADAPDAISAAAAR